MVLDREIEDKRKEDLSIDLSTDKYNSGKDKAKLINEAIDKGIARFKRSN